MPYVQAGRHRFNLADVEVVSTSAAVEGAVTVGLKSGREIELDPEAAAGFLAIFDDHAAMRHGERPAERPADRAGERAPPRVIRPRVIEDNETSEAVI